MATASAPRSWPRRCRFWRQRARPISKRSRSAKRFTCAATPPALNPSAWESLRRTKVFLKAPITTPQGGGFKSLNVTTRKTLGLYANVRPCVSYHPFVRYQAPDDGRGDRARERGRPLRGHRIPADRAGDAVPEADLAPGSEKIVRYAFEYARATTARKSPASRRTTS